LAKEGDVLDISETMFSPEANVDVIYVMNRMNRLVTAP